MFGQFNSGTLLDFHVKMKQDLKREREKTSFIPGFLILHVRIPPQCLLKVSFIVFNEAYSRVSQTQRLAALMPFFLTYAIVINQSPSLDVTLF